MPEATFWTGIQLDEAAFPVFLAAKFRERGVPEVQGTAAMVRSAIGFVLRSGPSSEQDRWEENAGINPFTIAVATSALVAASPWLSPLEKALAVSVANDWNDHIASWCYVTGTPLARECGVSGYYIRIAPPGNEGNLDAMLELKNRQGERIAASALVSMDFSYLVRPGAAVLELQKMSIRILDKATALVACTVASYEYQSSGGRVVAEHRLMGAA